MPEEPSSAGGPPVVILGAGAWGTALALHAARRDNVTLWARDAALVEAMRATRRNERGLPGVTLPPSVRLEPDLGRAVSGAGPRGLVVVATSVAGLRPVLERLRALPDFTDLPCLWLCKGLERATERLPHQVATEVLGEDHPVGVLSGPSFAQEVAQGLPVALSVASADAGLRARATAAFHHGAARIYATEDVVGVEIAGALKNVMAIAAGICDGMRLGHNARAALVSRGLAEIVRLGATLGARNDTFMGLAGVGDLVLTCTGDLSRNRQVGLRLAAGESLETIVAGLGHVAEGVPCARAARRLASRQGIEMPIVEAVCDVLDGRLTPRQALDALVARQPRHESPGVSP